VSQYKKKSKSLRLQKSVVSLQSGIPTIDAILKNCLKKNGKHIVTATQIREFVEQPYSINL